MMQDQLLPTTSSGPERRRSSGRSQHSQTQSTFGEIEFSGLKQQAKFARVDNGTSDQAIQQMLHKKWDLSRPTLVINIFGGNFEKKRQLKMIVKKGLWKAAESAGRDRSKEQGGCWIVTSGFNVGIMKLAGEAVRDYTDAYGANHMIAIGVASWGCVAKRRLLEAAWSEGNAPITYPTEETESSEQQVEEEEDDQQLNRMLRPLRPSHDEEVSLDSNHTHFFLVETGAGMRKGQELQLRSCLERAASCWRDDDNHEVKVPMCGLLIGGDRFCLEQVFHALTVNRCPIVVVKGSAGAADVLALSIDIFFQEDPVKNSDKEPDTEEERLQKFANKMAGVCQDFFNTHDYFDYGKEVGMLITIVKEYVGLIEIFDLEEDFDLDGKMISSLLSSAGSDCGPHQLNLKQLKICLTLNRADIARDKIFLENKKWKRGDLNDFMYQALMDDRHDFVKLLLEQGFGLEDFLTVYILEKLYTDQLKRVNSKVAIFNQLWEYCRSHRSGKKVRLKEVGKVIKVLMGDFYQPLYIKKEFDRTLLGAPENEGAGDGGQAKEGEQQFHGNNGGFDNPVMDLALEAAAADAMPVAAIGRKGNKGRWVRLIREQQRESRAKAVTLERPARELLIWSLLMGKQQMAELFWTMEKEPIAAALLSCKILKAMVTRTDDFTDTEDFLRGTELFEDRAWGVLDQCYREDERRAQFLINRELNFYGNSSCIYLAAEAKSIKFMAHPCCQDFLTGTWMGRLSPKNGLFKFAFGILCGLICPLLVPRVLRFKLSDKETLASEQQMQQKAKTLSSQASVTAGPDQVTLEMSTVQEGQTGQIQGQESASPAVRIHRPGSNEGDPSAVADFDAAEFNEADEPKNKYIKQLQRLSCSQMVERICGFYMAPVVRFVYNTFSFLTLLFLFSYLLLFELDHDIDDLECIVAAWILTLLLEEIKQATLMGDSFATYIGDGWNKLDCTAVGLFLIGFILRLISMNDTRSMVTIGMMTYDIILTDTLFIVARICYAFSLFAYFIRLMYIFSFHIALGPKLIMIGKMVVNDLIPFMVILLVFILGYGVAAQSIAYPNGLYTPDPNTNITMPEKMSHIGIFLQFLTRSYFPMFGEFALDTIQAKDDGCKNSGLCPHWTAKWLVPIMLGIYVLLTNILMFNLLIAMFSSTYESIHQFSAQHWNYQRYSMIREYLERSPLAPPLIVFWHIYELLFFIWMRCKGRTRSDLYDPLRINYRKNLKKERELIKWEHMKAMDYLRQGQEAHSRKARGGDSRSIIVRTSGAGQLLPGAADMAKQMSDATSGIGMELERKFKAVDTQLVKLSSDVESKVGELSNQVAMLGALARDLRDTQARLMQRLSENSPDPILAQDPRLEERVRAAVLGIYQADPPPWFLQAVRQAATEALRDTPVAVREVADAAVERIRTARASAEPPSGSGGGGDDVDAGRDSGDDDPTVLRPRVDDPGAGRVVQFGCQDHRLWRFAPFNFERYPGMRMNVPVEMVAWETEYPDYFAYDASDETPAYPNQDCHDQPSAALPSITFNQFDANVKVRRQSLLGRYRLDGASGAPLNPMGRTGLKAKGLLPRWGPNCAIVLALTRWSRSATGAVNHRLGQPILQVVSLARHKQFCLPWFLTDHLPDCDLEACVPSILRAFIGRRLKSLAGKRRAKQEIEALQKARTEQIFKGYLDDHMNADNAWIEAAVVNIHEPDDWRFSDALLKVFSEPDCDEQTKWIEVAYSTALRASHCELLKTVASNHSAYF